MKRRNFIRTAASGPVAASLGNGTRHISTKNPNWPVMELRVTLTTEAFERLASCIPSPLARSEVGVWHRTDKRRDLCFSFHHRVIGCHGRLEADRCLR
jgi:hypothetical protein